ncbi:hypothetical protein [Nocardia cyriacigeorgica]|uniref:hypothetical protein n=1 Tax=Nocardia cyriacigeorgica TaxID=135487 RepID=UPI0018934B3F|nr:hypothetical protein [Nocardia cyriacigeorgica]MBF6289893.1 hypothetical protein [Nocardia cyriacigeorgica]
MTSLQDPATTGQWLADQHHDFLEGLADQFDLAAGLREVHLRDRHTDLMRDLETRLDIEAGLAAILPTVPPVPVSAEGMWRTGSPQWAAGELATMPIPTRLQVRAAYAHKLGAAARSALRLSSASEVPAELEGEGDEWRLWAFYVEFDVALRQGDALEVERGRGIRVSYKMVGDQLQVSSADDDVDVPGAIDPTALWEMRISDSHVRDLFHLFEVRPMSDQSRTAGSNSGTTAQESDEPPPVLDDLAPSWLSSSSYYQRFVNGLLTECPSADASYGAQWLESVSTYVLETISIEAATLPCVDRAADLGERIAECLAAIADDLADFEHMLNDFLGADLSEVELEGIPLEGLRWSSATKWPGNWRDQIEKVSIQVADDIFEVHFSTPAHHGSLV